MPKLTGARRWTMVIREFTIALAMRKSEPMRPNRGGLRQGEGGSLEKLIYANTSVFFLDLSNKIRI
jgi:hypothetical protein